jgi:hypothetical protein
LIIAMALCSSFFAASSSVLETGIGTAVPTRTIRAIRAGWRDAHSSAVSEPMLWPTNVTLFPAAPAPHRSSSSSIQSARSWIVGSGSPSLRPCPGRSTARTPKPWCANQRLCRPQTLWSFCAPWMKTTVGRVASNALPPV